MFPCLKQETRFEFVEVVKANFHFANGYIFLITFDVLDPSENLRKPFQARIYYSSSHPTEFVFVRPKPDDPKGTRSFYRFLDSWGHSKSTNVIRCTLYLSRCLV